MWSASMWLTTTRSMRLAVARLWRSGQASSWKARAAAAVDQHVVPVARR